MLLPSLLWSITKQLINLSSVAAEAYFFMVLTIEFIVNLLVTGSVYYGS